MEIVQAEYKRRSPVPLVNYKKESIDANQPIIYVCWDETNQTEQNILLASVVELSNFQFVLGDSNLNLSWALNAGISNLYFAEQEIKHFQKNIDLLTIFSSQKSQGIDTPYIVKYFRDRTVVVNTPILYFCRDSKNTLLLNDRNIYVVSEQPSSDLFSLLIKRFFKTYKKRNSEPKLMLDAQIPASKDRNRVTISRREKMIEEQTVIDYSSRAASLQNEGDLDGAIEYYFRALKQKPQQQLWVFDSLAECLTAKGELQKALDVVQTGLRLYPKAASLYRFWGVIQDRQGDINDVIVNYDKAIALDENQPFWVYCVLADYYQRQGKLEESTRITFQGIKLYPQQADMYRCLGVIQDRQGNTEETINSYIKAIDLDPGQPFWVYCALIERLNAEDRAEEAVAVGHRGIKQYPQQPEIYYHLGAAQDKQNDIVGITNSYLQAIRLDRNQPVHLYSTLIERLLAQNELDRAIKLVSTASKLYPEQIDLFRSSYHKILEIRPEDLSLYKNLAQALRDNKEVGKP